jgi:hypothetical protein
MRERLQSRASRAVAGEPKGDSIQLPHRDAIERATGFDFSHVRAYSDREGLDQIGANAASHGNKVWFGDRDPSLATVAHELAHVRQASGLAMSSVPRQIGTPGSALEHEADAFASAVARGGIAPELGGRSDGNTLHLDPKHKKHDTHKTHDKPKTIVKIDVNFKHSDGHGNGVGKADVVLHFDDKTKKTLHGDGGGKKDAKGIHPTSGGKHHLDGSGKDPDHHSSVYNGPDGKPAPMKFYTPFAPGEGFHKGNPDDMSHGCVHLSEADAKEIFDHAGDGVEVDVNVPKDKPKKPAPKKEAPKKKPPPKKKKAE